MTAVSRRFPGRKQQMQKREGKYLLTKQRESIIIKAEKSVCKNFLRALFQRTAVIGHQQVTNGNSKAKILLYQSAGCCILGGAFHEHDEDCNL